MRLNEDIAIIGSHVVLVPYRKEHVPTYHEWMKSPELLEATASEPLSLDEEFEMQQKWHTDDDKLTFILLARPSTSATTPTTQEIKSFKMIGDVNLFLPNGVEEDVECEIMIAEKEFRGRGVANEALSLLLNYVTTPTALPLPTPSAPAQLIPQGHYPFLVRIGTSNTASIRLFEKLGFGKVKVVQAFDEVEMRFGWIPAQDGSEEGRMMSSDDMERLAKEKWTCRGQVVAYE